MTQMAPPPEQPAPDTDPDVDEQSATATDDERSDQPVLGTDRNTGHLTTPARIGEDTEPEPEEAAAETAREALTTVEVRAVGQLRRDLDEERFEFDFEGDTLRAFVGAFLAEHPGIEDRLVGETRRDDDAGWTDLQDVAGERTRPYVRVLVNGTFNEFLDGADTELSSGDRLKLVYPLSC